MQDTPAVQLARFNWARHVAPFQLHCQENPGLHSYTMIANVRKVSWHCGSQSLYCKHEPLRGLQSIGLCAASSFTKLCLVTHSCMSGCWLSITIGDISFPCIHFGKILLCSLAGSWPVLLHTGCQCAQSVMPLQQPAAVLQA